MADWREVVGSVAPGLATALGGPLAGAIVTILADKVLGRPGASEDDVIEALSHGSLSADQIVRIKEAERDLQVELAKVQASREAVGYADVASAREREVAMAQAPNAGWLNLNLVPIMALTVVIGGGLLLYFSTDQDIKYGVTSLMTLVLGYYFGKSSSDWKMTATIDRLVKQKE